MRALTKVALASGMLMLMAGCSTKYLMTSQFVVSSQAEAEPELVVTPKYKEVKGKVVTVAVKAPDNCSNRTADDATGAAHSRESVLKTTCGIEMAEIERALARKGFKVISWKAMEMAMKSNDSISAAAGALGAEVIFQINSLETSTRNMGKDARWERAFYVSDDFARKVKDQPLSDGVRNYLRKSYLEAAEQGVLLSRQAVTLDATATLVQTGESIWYYRWSHAEAVKDDAGRQVLLRCKKSALSDVDKLEKISAKTGQKAYWGYPDPRIACQRAVPKIQPGAPEQVTMSSMESDAVSVAERPEDREKAVYSELLGNVIRSLVDSFGAREAVLVEVPAVVPQPEIAAQVSQPVVPPQVDLAAPVPSVAAPQEGGQ